MEGLVTNLLNFHLLFYEQGIMRIESHHGINSVGGDFPEGLTLEFFLVRSGMKRFIRMSDESSESVSVVLTPCRSQRQ